MGQYWELLDLDRRETSSLGKLGAVFFSQYVDKILMERLTRIELLPPRMDFHTLPNAQPPYPDRPQLLANFPIELITKIFEYLDYGIDCICLAVSCQDCWSIGAKIVQQRYLDALPSMAGDRIIVIGDYAEADDLPEGLHLTRQEQYELRRDESEDPGEMEHASVTEAGDPYLRSLYDLADTKYSPLSRFDIDKWVNELTMERGLFERKSIEMVRSLANRKCGEENDLVLRNLSRRQFVRASACADLNKRVRHGHNANLGFVVFSRICWSSDSSISMSGDGLHRGIWAGERFDIVAEEAHERERLQDRYAWIDIGKEAVQELEELYRDNEELAE